MTHPSMDQTPKPQRPMIERRLRGPAEPRYLSASEVVAWQHEHEAGNRVPPKVLRALFRTAGQLYLQRVTLAKLAADTPQFSNLVDVWDAQSARDSALAIPGDIYTTETRRHV